MDYAAAGRRDKNENKENAEPPNRVQSFIKNKSAPQFRQKITQQTGIRDVNSKQPHGKVTTGGKKTVKEFSKPPLSAVAVKPAPGMYKGKIVESKIAYIWKLGSTAEKSQASSSTLKHQSPKSTNLEKKMRPKSVFDRPAQVPRSAAPSCAWTGPLGSSARTVSAILTSISYGSHHVGSDRTQKSKPNVPEVDKTVSKPHSSIYAQNKCTMETKERRGKLAEWQASKGKTLKRPAMKMAQAKLVVKHSASVDAPATSPISEDESAPVINVSSTAELEDGKPKDEREEVLRYEKKEGVSNKLQVTQVKSKKQSLAAMAKETESKEERVMEPMPQKETSSMIKYSVTTTPYLQSVKKTLDDAGTSAYKNTGSIKDLKFLTPVRRSCRIQRQSFHLPAMLQDHDPCVNSLAELATLDDSPNAFIYRKNPALTEYIKAAKTEIC